jgi:hypothetical protein
MTKEEVIQKLKIMFIEKFGVGTEVSLKKRIVIDHSWDVGDTDLTKVRYNGKKFEYYKECWGGDWDDKQSVFNKHVIAILSDALGVNVKTKTEYFIS